jgi:predicted nucleic acid-binding protein
MIVSSALICGCGVLVTEDLNSGQKVEDRLIIYNPFV